MAEVLALMRAFSIGRVTSCGKTGLTSIDPGTGSFHVFNISSIFRLTLLSTKAYASIKVE
jgi:hypothetical protein